MNARSRINYLWRLLATGLAYIVFGIAGILIPLISAPVLYVLPGTPENRLQRARRLVHWLFKGFIHLMRMLGLLTWQTRGLEKLNRPGLLVLANHPTLIDVVFMIAFIPNASCIVKSRLLANPVMRGLINQAGYIPNDMGDKLLSGADEALRCGSTLLIFPEGTRTHPGEALKFRRGAANIAIRCRKEVTPVIIRSSHPTLSKGHKWYHIPPQRFEMTFTVNDDIAIAPYLDDPATLAARRMTRSLEQYFTKEMRINGSQELE